MLDSKISKNTSQSKVIEENQDFSISVTDAQQLNLDERLEVKQHIDYLSSSNAGFRESPVGSGSFEKSN